MKRHFKIVVEKHRDSYVAYPCGVGGVVIGEGDTYEEALHARPPAPKVDNE